MPHVHSVAAEHRGRLQAVLAITLGLLVAEVVGGLAANSLALLADAGHLLTDALGLGVALAAITIGRRPPDDNRSFGLLRLEILSAVTNAVLLFGVAAVVLVESFQRLAEPPETSWGPMLVVAAAGLCANAISLRLLHDGRKTSLNVRGAYLEVLGDTLGTMAVLVAGIFIALGGSRTADGLASALIGLLILPRAWGLLREALDVLLEASPRNLDMALVRAHILEAPGVIGLHDLHAWTITSGLNVLSAHVVVSPEADPDSVLAHLCECLQGVFDVEHSTFQLETSDRRHLETILHD